jgi:hypothetical protein
MSQTRLGAVADLKMIEPDCTVWHINLNAMS